MKHHVTYILNLDVKKLRGCLLFLLLSSSMLIFVAAGGGTSQGENAITWGVNSNGLRLGVQIHSVKIGQGLPPICVLYLENVGTNELFLRLPKLKNRYRVQVSELDNKASLRRTGRPLSDAPWVRRSWLSPNTPYQVDHFSIPETFQIKTNGAFALAVSARIAISLYPTNLLGRDAAYFWLPFATNTFDIPNPLRR